MVGTISKGLGLLGLVSADGEVYTWAPPRDAAQATESVMGDATRVYTPPPGWAVRELSLSPTKPYLAVVEVSSAQDERWRVAVIDLGTNSVGRPPGAVDQPGSVLPIRWSDDGLHLYVTGQAPCLLKMGDAGPSVAWDLSAIREPNTEVRSPLLCSDLSGIAYTAFHLDADDTEDLWFLERDLRQPRRLTRGGLGGYPLAWLEHGAPPSGQAGGGEGTALLIGLGAVSTGGGITSGLAAIDVRTGKMDVWYAEESLLINEAALVDRSRRKALIVRASQAGREDGRIVWRWFPEGKELVVSGLNDLGFRHPAVLLEDGSAVILVRAPGLKAAQLWQVLGDGSARQLGVAPAGAPATLLGTAQGWPFIVSEAVPSGAEAPARTPPQLSLVDVAGGRILPVRLRAASKGP
jgi:hypothetical protein